MQFLESNFQTNIVRLLRTQGFYVFAVPNAGSGKLSLRQGALLKREGLLAGVSDLIIVLQNKIIFVEIKNPNGKGRQSENQKEFEQEIKKRGHDYFIWDSWPQVEAFIKENKDKK